MRNRSRLLAAVLAALSQAATAGERGAPPAAPLLPAYQAECSGCHVAYPPGLLPAASWQRVMQTLPQHYGADASLDPAQAAALSAWLQAHAGTSRRAAVAPPEDRITRSAWFIRKHDEVPAAAWQRPSIKSAANCGACHPKADQGDFNEHQVRIPR
ncbi:MAG TPA: diheme cytochrome c [Burkholderiaceae bacterium]|nr:diheme cytochrome c [Burkholderiaceae bacterium]